MNNFSVISVWHQNLEAGQTPAVIKDNISKISAEVNKEVGDLHQGTLKMVFAGYNIDPEDEYNHQLL